MTYQTYVQYRDKAGLNDNQVAKQTGISTGTISAWKKGEYTPKAEKQLLIAALLGVKPEDVWKDRECTT